MSNKDMTAEEWGAILAEEATALLPESTPEEREEWDIVAQWNELDESYYVAEIKDRITDRVLWPTRNFSSGVTL